MNVYRPQNDLKTNIIAGGGVVSQLCSVSFCFHCW